MARGTRSQRLCRTQQERGLGRSSELGVQVAGEGTSRDAAGGCPCRGQVQYKSRL